jgi:hypothetical protein
MKKSRLQMSLTAAALILTMLACAVPGLSPASAPAPTADTVLLATMVAETVAAALEETASAVTPVPTPTLLPPLPTETATLELPSTGSMLTRQGDGSTHFVDERAGYELTVPAGWLAVRVNEQEYFDAWTLAETSDPSIQESLTSIQNQDPNQFRLFALDTQDGHLLGGFVTNINFIWNELADMSLEDESDLLATSAALSEAIPGMEILATELNRTASGVPIGRITSKWPPQTLDGAEIVIFQKQVFMDLRAGILTITLTTTEELSELVLPPFDSMVETILVSE